MGHGQTLDARARTLADEFFAINPEANENPVGKITTAVS